MLNEQFKVTGDVLVEITGPDGKIKDRREIKNVVVTNGKSFIASSILKTTSNTPTAMTHMAIGSGTATAVVGDSTLGTEISGTRTAVSSSASGAVVTYTASFAAGVGTGNVTEAGVFNAASGGTMLCRTVFGVVTKGADDTMSINWAITVS